MQNRVTNLLSMLAIVLGAALFAFSISSLIGAIGGASLMPYGPLAFAGIGALMGSLLVAAVASPVPASKRSS